MSLSLCTELRPSVESPSSRCAMSLRSFERGCFGGSAMTASSEVNGGGAVPFVLAVDAASPKGPTSLGEVG